MTNTALKTQIDTQITNETVDLGITPAEVGNNIKAVVDYADQQDAFKENTLNKSIDVTTDGESDTKYPTVKSVKTYVDSNNALFELWSNRSTNVAADATSDTKYPSVKAVKTYVDGRTPDGVSQQVTASDVTPPDIKDLTYVRVYSTADYKEINLSGIPSVGKEWYVKNPTNYIVQLNGTGENINGNSYLRLPPNSYWHLIKEDNGTNNITAFSLSLELNENTSNKSIDVTTDGSSDTKYPSVKAVKTYVDANTGGGTSVTKVVKTTITSAQILDLFTTPITVLDSSDPTTIKLPLNVWVQRKPGTPYTLSSASFLLVNDFGNNAGGNLNPNPLGSADIGFFTSTYTVSQNGAGYDKNTLYKLKASTGNPTGGTGDIDVYVTYIEITL